MQLLLRNAKILDSKSKYDKQIVDILIEDGTIREIGNSLPIHSATVFEAEHVMVSQGWVDVFADYCEPGFEQKETIASGLATAAAAGFTDVFLVPNTAPAISTKSIVEFVLVKAKNSIVNLHPLGAITQHIEGKDLAEMMDMQCSGAIAFTDGWKPIQNAGLALKAMEYMKAFGGIFLQVPVDANLSFGGLMNEGINSTALGMPGIPTLAETIMLHRDIELLRYTGSRLHVTGISTSESVEMIQKAKAEGLQITCSVTPYHLRLTDNVLYSYNSVYKVNPPLRSEADRQCLIRGLENGTIDCIATHHHPHEWDAKVKEFEYAANGMAVQENAFPVLWDTLKEYISIDKLIEILTNVPRSIFGLEKNSIMLGNKATLTVFTTGGTSMLPKDKTQSKSMNNPFTDIILHGKVYGIVNNNQVHLNK